MYNRLTLLAFVALVSTVACSSTDQKSEPPSAKVAESGKSADTSTAKAEDSQPTAKSREVPQARGSRESGNTMSSADASGNIMLGSAVSAEVTAEEGAKLMKEPSSQSEVVQEIKAGSSLSVKGFRRGIYVIGRKPGRWVQVDAGGKTGWVFGGTLAGPSVATGGALPEAPADGK